jgi:hypothetical protein
MAHPPLAKSDILSLMIAKLIIKPVFIFALFDPAIMPEWGAVC